MNDRRELSSVSKLSHVKHNMLQDVTWLCIQDICNSKKRKEET